jgi:hypothetical protein
MVIETEATTLIDYAMAYDLNYLYDLQNRGVKSTTGKIMVLLTEPIYFDPDKSIEFV